MQNNTMQVHSLSGYLKWYAKTYHGFGGLFVRLFEMMLQRILWV
jgi:hypothetical protein